MIVVVRVYLWSLKYSQIKFGGLRSQFVIDNGSIQELLKFAKYSRHHWCNSNPHPKVKSSCSYNKILVLQIKGIQYAVACHCWPHEKIRWHFRGDIKVYEWCKSFLFVFKGKFVQRLEFTWRFQAICDQGQRLSVVFVVDGTT